MFENHSISCYYIGKGVGIVSQKTGEFVISYGRRQDLKKIFPIYKKDYQRLEALLAEGSYQLLLLSGRAGEDLLGYALVCKAGQALWLDYLAISSNCRGMGLGSYFFQEIPQLWKNQGMFLEVEMATSNNPAQRGLQQKRIDFYERLGAQRLALPYLFPTEKGAFPMHLYYKPNGEGHPYGILAETLTWVFDNLHKNIASGKKILRQNLQVLGEQLE